MNPFEAIKNLKNMQEMMQDFQRKLPELIAVGESGGGMVKVTMDGTMLIRSVVIDPEVIDATDPEFLQDLIKLACADAHGKIKDLLAKEMSGLAGMSGVAPGMFGL